MKRLLALGIALSAAAFCAAQTRLSISMKGKPVGFATLSQHLEQDGSKVVELRLELGAGDQKVKLNVDARYDAKGMPTRKFQETVSSAGRKQVVATFTKEGASLTIIEDSKRSLKTIPLVATAPRVNLSEFWFIRDTPKVGQVEDTYQFNTDTLQWDLTHTEYHGKRTVKIEGKSVSAHEIVTKRGDKTTTAYLDDQGLPVLIDQGDVKMVKIWQK